MSTGAMVSDMRAMVKENPQAVFNARKIADGTGMTAEEVIKDVNEWIQQGWAKIHPETDSQVYEFVLTEEGVKALF